MTGALRSLIHRYRSWNGRRRLTAHRGGARRDL